MNHPKIIDIAELLGSFCVYYIVFAVVLSAAQMLLGNDVSHYAVCNIVAASITIFAVLPFYRRAWMEEGGNSLPPRQMLVHIAAAAAIAVFWAMALNNLISMSPLVTISESYQRANRYFYGSTLWLELVSSAVLTPILEELVFRGIIFCRLKELLGIDAAVPSSALLFAIMHFNIVQFIYAFVIGILLALLMERAGHLCAAIAGHMAANALAVIRTETGLFAETADGSPFAWCVSTVLLAAGNAALLLYTKFHFSMKNAKKVD